MPTPDRENQDPHLCEAEPHGEEKDSEGQRQLELEIEAFAELLLDIHEYWRAQKPRNPQP